MCHQRPFTTNVSGEVHSCRESMAAPSVRTFARQIQMFRRCFIGRQRAELLRCCSTAAAPAQRSPTSSVLCSDTAVAEAIEVAICASGRRFGPAEAELVRRVPIPRNTIIAVHGAFCQLDFCVACAGNSAARQLVQDCCRRCTHVTGTYWL